MVSVACSTRDVGTKFENRSARFSTTTATPVKLTTPTIGDVPLEGFTAVMTPTTAKVLASYTGYGGAAITENSLGTAVILGAEASLNRYKWERQDGSHDSRPLR